jgi:hypothetical protein
MSIAQQIKDILVSLAVQDKLPLDLTELDPGIFEPALAGAVFPGELKDRYVSLEVPDPSRFIGPGRNKILVNIRVKLDDEGVVVDAFQPQQDGDTGEHYQEPIATTWKTYQMMKDGEE